MQVDPVVPGQGEAGPGTPGLRHPGRLHQAGVVQADRQGGNQPFPSGVEDHSQALFPAPGVNMEPGVQALGARLSPSPACHVTCMFALLKCTRSAPSTSLCFL